MINFYVITEVARLEYEERVRSLAPIPDFFETMKADQPGLLLRQARRWRSVLGNKLAGLGEWMKRGRAGAPDAPFVEQKGPEVPS